MKKTRLILTSLMMFLLVVGLAANAFAVLNDLGGGLIYDSANDVTWVQNANGFSGTLTGAHDWANNLVYASYDDWRLASIFLLNDLYNSGITTTSQSPFLEVQSAYWSSTCVDYLSEPLYYDCGPSMMPDAFLGKSFIDGSVIEITNKSLYRTAWAFRDGLSVVPEPISSILFVTGGTLFAARTARKRRRAEVRS